MTREPDPFDSDTSPFMSRAARPLVQRVFPFVRELRGYRGRTRGDSIAGITVAALGTPPGMGSAKTERPAPDTHPYTLLLPALAYMLFGSSRQLIVGPEGSLAVMVAAGLAPMAVAGTAEYASLAALLALLTGGFFVVARVCRLGWIADYFSRAVLVGYLHGVAVVLVTSQLGKLFGVSIDAEDPIPQLAEFFRELADRNSTTVLVSAISIAVLLICRHWFPKIPAALIVVVGGIVVSYAVPLSEYGVAIVGQIASGLPDLGMPSATAGELAQLVPIALGLFAVCYADGVLTARAFAGKHGQSVNANQELVGLGSANVFASISQAFPVGASGSRTAVNDQMGGRTQLVGGIAAVVTALVLVFLTAPIEYLPKACLGAIIVVAAIGLIEPAAWRALATAGKGEVLIAGVAMVGVITVGVLRALVVALVLSIIEVVARTARPHDAVLGWVERLGRYADVSLHPSARITAGLVVYRLDDRLIFANADYFQSRVGEAIEGATTPTLFVVFDAEAMNGIDASGVEAMEQLVARLHREGITFVVARLRSAVEDQFRDTGLVDLIGADHFHPNVRAAVKACRDVEREEP